MDLDDVRQSPRDAGRIELIVRRPEIGQRDIVDEFRQRHTSLDHQKFSSTASWSFVLNHDP